MFLYSLKKFVLSSLSTTFIFVMSLASNNALALNNGSTTNGTINGAEVDTYTFDASVGEYIFLRAGDISSFGFEPKLELRDPLGTLIDTNTGGGAAGIDTLATQSGTYSIDVSDNDSSGSGNYALSYAKIPGVNEHGVLQDGVEGLERVSTGDIDSFTLSASAGQYLVVRAGLISGGSGFDPRLVVFAPSVTIVGDESGGLASTAEGLLTENGTYTAVIGDSSLFLGLQGVGDYRINYVVIPGSNELGSLSNDTIVTEALDLGDLDTFTFYASNGDTVTLELIETVSGAGFAPQMQVFDPSASIVADATTDNSSIANDGFVAAQTGTYTILIRDNSNPSNGTDGAKGSYSIEISGLSSQPSEAVEAPLSNWILLVFALVIGNMGFAAQRRK